jgi:hypothetical protein
MQLLMADQKTLSPVSFLLRDFQRREAFVASLSIENKNTFFHCALPKKSCS